MGSIVDVHTSVVEPPEVLALEEVGQTVGVLERGIHAMRHTPPHADVTRVVTFHAAIKLVVAPVLVPAKEVSLSIVSPNHGSIQVSEAGWQAKIRQWAWITRKGFISIEQPVFFS